MLNLYLNMQTVIVLPAGIPLSATPGPLIPPSIPVTVLTISLLSKNVI